MSASEHQHFHADGTVCHCDHEASGADAVTAIDPVCGIHTTTYQVKGMHCASCANVIERAMKKVAGVEAASANYGNESVTLTFAGEPSDPQTLARKLKSPSRKSRSATS